MADVVTTNTRRKFYRIDDGVIALLLEMFPEALERIRPADVRPQRDTSPPTWKLYASPFDGRVIGLSITLPPRGEALIVEGPAKEMRARCEAALAGRPLPLPTDELIAEYGARTATLTPEQAADLAAEHASKVLKQQYENDQQSKLQGRWR
jgi:hypothetical protein